MDWSTLSWPSLEGVAPWHWWILGAGLLILEVLAPGIFFVWLALAAFATGLLIFVLPLPVVAQLLLFCVLSGVAVFAGRRYLLRLPAASDAGELGRGGGRFIGQRLTVSESIVDGVGKVRAADSTWRVRGPDTPAGQTVRVVRAEGPTLYVEAVNSVDSEAVDSGAVDSESSLQR
jgi:inner membrane protein